MVRLITIKLKINIIKGLHELGTQIFSNAGIEKWSSVAGLFQSDCPSFLRLY